MTTISIYTKNPQDKAFFSARFETTASLHFYENAEQTPHADTDVLSVFTDVPVTRKLIETLPKLRLIAIRSTGVDHIDVAAAKEHDVAVAHVGGYGAITVAEYAITPMLMLSRKMPQVLQESAKSTPQRLRECGMDVCGKTLGLIGTGAIGMGVAKIAGGLGMNIIGYDVYPNQEKAKAVNLTYKATAEEVLQTSDVVSLHMPLLDSTRHFMTAERLSAMKPSAILLNTARGELVDTAALLQALQTGKLAAAGLDVVEESPEVAQLKNMDTVIITNHNAYNTTEAIGRINQKTFENITNFLANKAFDHV